MDKNLLTEGLMSVVSQVLRDVGGNALENP